MDHPNQAEKDNLLSSDLAVVLRKAVGRAFSVPVKVNSTPSATALIDKLNPFLVDVAEKAQLPEATKMRVLYNVISTKGKYVPTEEEAALFADAKDDWSRMISGCNIRHSFMNFLEEHSDFNDLYLRALDKFREYELDHILNYSVFSNSFEIRIESYFNDLGKSKNEDIRDLHAYIYLIANPDNIDNATLDLWEKHPEKYFLMYEQKRADLIWPDFAELVIAGRYLKRLHYSFDSKRYMVGRYNGKYHHDEFDRTITDTSKITIKEPYLEEYEHFDYALFLYRRVLDRMINRGNLSRESLKNNIFMRMCADRAFSELFSHQLFNRAKNKSRRKPSEDDPGYIQLCEDLKKYGKYSYISFETRKIYDILREDYKFTDEQLKEYGK